MVIIHYDSNNIQKVLLSEMGFYNHRNEAIKPILKSKQKTMEKNNPIKIIVENNGEKIELETPWDSGLDDWDKVFRVVLKWLTFGDSTVNEFYGRDDSGEELPNLPEEDNKKYV